MRDHENARGLFEWARGHAKSTHISLLQPLWLKIQPNAQPLIMILVSKSRKPPGACWATLRWAESTTSITQISAINGEREYGRTASSRRPQAICSSRWDADSRREASRSAGCGPIILRWTTSTTTSWCAIPGAWVKRWTSLMTALLGTMAMGRGRLAVVGNRIGRTSVIGTLADNPHFHHTVVNALDRKGLPSWPQNYTLREIAEMRGIMGEQRFQREYMNNPVNAGTVFEKAHPASERCCA